MATHFRMKATTKTAAMSSYDKTVVNGNIEVTNLKGVLVNKETKEVIHSLSRANRFIYHRSTNLSNNYRMWVL